MLPKITDLLFSLAGLVILVSCDTERNIKPVNHFLKYYGEQGDQEAIDMVVANDGSIFLLGNSGADLYVVRVDVEGNSVWENKYPNQIADAPLIARDIELTSSGDLLILANTREPGSANLDFAIITLSQDGIETNRIVDGYPGFDEQAYSVTEISDGFLVAGSTTKVKAPTASGDLQDGFIFRYDLAFNSYGINWSNDYVQYGPGTTDVVVKAYEARPGFLYMFGYSNQTDALDQTPDFNFFVFSVNNDGVTNSLKFTPGLANANEILTSVKMISSAASDGFLLAGLTETNGLAELYTIRIRGNIETISNEGDLIQNEKTITSFGLVSTANSTPQNTKAIGLPASSGFLILSSENQGGNDNIYLTRLDNSLAVVDRTNPGLIFGGIGNDTASAISELADGSILILGTMVLGEVNGQRKMVLMKVNEQGRFE